MGKHGRPLTKSRYMTEVRKGHPVAHADGRVRIHRANLYDALGPGPHPCHWCGKEVAWDGVGAQLLVADHVNEDTWDNRLENLVASCTRCNSFRRTLHATTCGNGHERTEENTYYSKDGKRSCRECHRLAERRAWREGRRPYKGGTWGSEGRPE